MEFNIDNKIFKKEDLEKCIMTKEQIWAELHGKTVKCVYSHNEDIHMFAVQDLKTGKIYLLDTTSSKYTINSKIFEPKI